MTGIRSIQPGGGGTCIDATEVAQSTILSPLTISTVIAAPSGTMKPSRSTSDMVAAEMARRPPTRASSRIMMGHVATTMVAAQMMAPMNGRRIQSVPTSMAARQATPRVTRATSKGLGSSIMAARYCTVALPGIREMRYCRARCASCAGSPGCSSRP